MTDVRIERAIERLSRELQPRSSSRAGRPRQPVDAAELVDLDQKVTNGSPRKSATKLMKKNPKNRTLRARTT